MQLDNPSLTIGIALTAGMVAQALARHLRIPGIVLLLLAGLLLGPDGAGVVRPGTLGPALQMIVGFAVAVILFEGGLNLEVQRLRREALTIRRLVTVGALVTGIGGTLAARYIMGWNWQLAVPFGTLVIVTGPTVITPLLRRIRPNRNVHTILEAEGVLIDPIGAILAVVALEVVLSKELGTAVHGLLGIPTRLLIGVAAGAAGGLVLGKVLARPELIPQGLESVFTLAFLFGLFETSDAVQPESGIVAATMAGLVVGNLPGRVSLELKEFKEQLTVLLVALLFVLLAADVRLSEVTGLGWRGVATVAVLMFVVRPLDVLASTVRSGTPWRERAFIAWLGPRGIVAAAVASLFAEQLTLHGVAAGVELRALVFLVIAATVVIQGLSGGLVASLLRVRRPTDTGYAIAGANALGRALARSLHSRGEDVVLIDASAAEARTAQEEGLNVLHGNALDDEILTAADLDSRRGAVSVVPNEGVGLLFAQTARRRFRVQRVWVAVRARKVAVTTKRLADVGGRLLFGREIEMERWIQDLAEGRATVRSFAFRGPPDRALREVLAGHVGGDLLVPLTVTRAGAVSPADADTRLRPGDVVTLVCADDAGPQPHRDWVLQNEEPTKEPGLGPAAAQRPPHATA